MNAFLFLSNLLGWVTFCVEAYQSGDQRLCKAGVQVGFLFSASFLTHCSFGWGWKVFTNMVLWRTPNNFLEWGLDKFWDCVPFFNLFFSPVLSSVSAVKGERISTLLGFANLLKKGHPWTNYLKGFRHLTSVCIPSLLDSAPIDSIKYILKTFYFIHSEHV